MLYTHMSGSHDWTGEGPHLIGSPESVEPKRHSHSRWASGLVAGLMAGLVIGWAVRGTLASRDQYTPPNRESSPSSLLQENQRSPIDTEPTEIAPKQAGGTLLQRENDRAKANPAAVSIPDTKPTAKHMLGPIQPMPLPGNIGEASPVVPGPPADLHSLEARVRVIATSVGGSVVAVRDVTGTSGTTAKSLTLALPKERVDAFTARVHKELSAAALVEEPVPGSTDEANDPAKLGQLKREETQLDEVKQRLHKAQLDFYSDAPALRNVEAEYADQLRKVDELRRSLNVPVHVTVVLTAVE